MAGGWLARLARSPLTFAEVRAEAARLHQAEVAQLAILRAPQARARLCVWSLAEVTAAPATVLAQLLDGIDGPRVTPAVQGPAAPQLLPALADLSGLPALVRRLRDAGLPVAAAADFTAPPPVAPPTTPPRAAGWAR